MKSLIKILVLFSLFVLASCVPPNYSCGNDSDCKGDGICVDTLCTDDPCLREENICGKGKCIPGRLDDGKDYNSSYGVSYHCECDEEAMLIKKVSTSGFYFCSPKCNSYSEECVKFSNGKYFTNYNECNIPAGHCDTKCEGEGSCQDGYICETGVCWRKID